MLAAARLKEAGIKDFRIRAEELSNFYGERFYPPKLLDKMIAKGETFK